ncbi:hypothetical protein [Nocardia wallacei]|uniref:Uncharacterized protein n=1 Tax=Nocardia wallacei TaxID=480035 RepID=A0A7G1KMG0_9NOCA|nr:hypothetical protein [Nocardia wallacei]BCK56417.1 hypothetical protein NWFMUON74_41890 [Nocardia wallacei]
MHGSTWAIALAALIFLLAALALLTLRIAGTGRRSGRAEPSIRPDAARPAPPHAPPAREIPSTTPTPRQGAAPSGAARAVGPDSAADENGRPKRTNRMAPRDTIER